MAFIAITGFSFIRKSGRHGSQPCYTDTIIHYELVGEVHKKHVQIPPVEYESYADISDKVSLSFDWDRNKNQVVGKLEFRNYPGTTTNLMGMGKGCPTGKINGSFEYFDIVEVELDSNGPIKLIGKRIHPETQVAESCGAGLRTYRVQRTGH